MTEGSWLEGRALASLKKGQRAEFATYHDRPDFHRPMSEKAPQFVKDLSFYLLLSPMHKKDERFSHGFKE